MMRVALERGLSSLIAQWMLRGRADDLISRVAATGALPAEELEALRRSTRAHLERVEAEGAPYAEVLLAALGGVKEALPDLAQVARKRDAALARTVAMAVTEALAGQAAQAARAATSWAAEAGVDLGGLTPGGAHTAEPEAEAEPTEPGGAEP